MKKCCKIQQVGETKMDAEQPKASSSPLRCEMVETKLPCEGSTLIDGRSDEDQKSRSSAAQTRFKTGKILLGIVSTMKKFAAF